MSLKVVDQPGDIKIYGDGLWGGKGIGLARINECTIPNTAKLKTRILSTTFYDRFMESGKKFGKEESDTIESIMNELGDAPIGVRSSATNEAGMSAEGQQYFYALDMTKNRELRGEELETMKNVHVDFANYHKIKLLGISDNLITIEELIQNNHYRFKTSLSEITETIYSFTDNTGSSKMRSPEFLREKGWTGEVP